MKRGYVTLLSVLIVGAVGTAVTVSLLFLGLTASRTSFVVEQAAQARMLADACAEEALQQIRSSTAYTGTAGLSLGQGSCTYTVVSTGGENRTITASGIVGTVTRRTEVLVSAINPSITISSWQEVASF